MTEDIRKYTDSCGAELALIGLSAALRIIHSLAEQNQITDHDIGRGNDALSAQREWQQQALDTVQSILEKYADRLDALEPSRAARTWPEEVTLVTRDLDATIPVNAIRICREKAEQGALDPSDAGSIGLAEEIDRQQQALDLVANFLGIYGIYMHRPIEDSLWNAEQYSASNWSRRACDAALDAFAEKSRLELQRETGPELTIWHLLVSLQEVCADNGLNFDELVKETVDHFRHELTYIPRNRMPPAAG